MIGIDWTVLFEKQTGSPFTCGKMQYVGEENFEACVLEWTPIFEKIESRSHGGSSWLTEVGNRTLRRRYGIQRPPESRVSRKIKYCNCLQMNHTRRKWSFAWQKSVTKATNATCYYSHQKIRMQLFRQTYLWPNLYKVIKLFILLFL